PEGELHVDSRELRRRCWRTPTPSAQLPRIDMEFTFRHGWCTLRLISDQQDISIKATTMRDAFTDLLIAVNRLAVGSVCQSVVWGGEGRGAFIDMTLAHDFELGLVIHEMADPNWLRPG